MNYQSRIYKTENYKEQAASSSSSAREKNSKILSIKKIISVIYVGCGVGTWLQTAKQGTAKIKKNNNANSRFPFYEED